MSSEYSRDFDEDGKDSPYPSLGEDILYTLLDHLDQAGISVMMRTCKSLHAMGLKPLLRSGVTVRSMKQLTEFCQFILDDLPLRARCLRKLSISMSLTDYIAHVDEQLLDAVEHRVGSLDLQKTPSEGLPLLVQILTHTTEVADLNIDSAEQLLQRHDGLVSGFAGLPRLRRLRMSSAGPKVLAMMRTIKANLREVHLDCFHQYSTSRTAVDVIPFSQSHHRTLEKLTVSYCNIRAPTENTVFLCMRELILRFTYGLDAALLSRCFPDLRHLELWHVRARHGNTPVHIRTANYGKCCERSWLALDHLSGDLNALFALAFTRRVKLLDIRFPPQAAILTMPRLHTLLSETSPSHLRLYLGYNRNGFSPTEIAQLLATPSALRITHLLLDIRLGNWTGTADALQDSLVSMLSPLSVFFFALRLGKLPQPSGTTQPTPPVPVYDSDDNARLVDSLVIDHDVLALRLSLCSAHSRYISIHMSGETPQYWSVVRELGNVTLGRIDAVVARRVLSGSDDEVWFTDKDVGGLS